METANYSSTIISRTPLRLPLGGGGTDLPSYYKEYGGFFVSAAINKYMNIVIHPRIVKGLRLAYSKTEIVNNADEVEHPIIREALRKTAIKYGLEILSFADVPASTGLGSSGSFAVGLLRGLHSVKHEFVGPADIAEEACDISMNILKEPSGKQDEYVASFGGIRAYKIGKNGKVEIEELKLPQSTIADLESNIMLFYTGLTRESREVLSKQQKNIRSGSSVEQMHKIKEIGMDSKKALEKGDLTRFGELLHEHWLAKRSVTDNMTNDFIDKAVETARNNGAIGEKILGAGGGGFLMVYADENHKKIRSAMEAIGMPEHRVRFDFEGSKVIYNI
ncbi:MAG: galactokinase [Candidatus Micrarchaeota archaeon]|nr:galactokinase [Candidatus Micrarchaeota archaeon]MDE1834137.1 galactokinase [Candidatus Micrarchaeota archaeon]MDE1859536.1 galactokinase [Candidatus Micrarchaeota archaeon]